MEFNIFTAQLNGMDFAPASIYEEIAQNVKTICTTPKYSVPLDREFGVDMSFVDKPQIKAAAMLQSEIIQAVRKYEPRCKVVRVKYNGTFDGVMDAEIRIAINK